MGMGDEKALICGACWEQYKRRCSLHGGMSDWEVSVWLGWGVRKHLFVVHAGSNTRGDVLFMEVCQKLGLSLVGMGDEKALICGACWEQYKRRCSPHGGTSDWEVSVWLGWGMRKHSFVVHAGSNTRGDVLLMEVCQTGRSQFGWDGG